MCVCVCVCVCVYLCSPELVRGVQLYNISLRGLHVERQPSWQRPFVAAFQQLLRETQLGVAFFGSVAKEQVRCELVGMGVYAHMTRTHTHTHTHTQT